MSKMLDAALTLSAEGFKVLQLGKGSKRAIRPWRELQTSGASDEQIETWWTEQPEGNIGIICGNGLVVVDCDSPKAVAWVEAKLPRTPWRVKTSRGWHHFYRGTVKPFSDGDLKLDVKGQGGYVVGPPSIHESGHIYRWHRDPGTESWDVDDLPELTDQDFQPIRPEGGTVLIDLARIKLQAEEVPTPEGARNNSAASLMGQYLSKGASPAVALQRLHEWNQSNPDPLDDAELVSVAKSITETHLHNHPRPEPQTGVRVQPKANPGVSIEEMRPPGTLGDVFDFQLETAAKPNPTMAAQACLALGSVVMGRLYQTTAANLSSLYLLTVAKSSSGKEHGKKVIEHILEAADLGDLISGSGYTSPGAVFTELKRAPSHLCVIDEIGAYLQAVKAPGNSMLKEATTVLMEAFTKLDGSLRPRAYSNMTQAREDADPLVIRFPAITLLGLTTPGTLYDQLSMADIEGGFLSRLLVVEDHSQRTKGRPPKVLPKPPGSVIAWCKAARRDRSGSLVGEQAELSPSPYLVGISTEAEQVFDRDREDVVRLQDKLDSARLDSLVGRRTEIAMRVALILAGSVDIERPKITGELAEWACKYVGRAFDQLINSVTAKLVGTRYGKTRADLLEIITLSGGRGLTEREMKRKTKGLGLRPKDLEEMLIDLANSEEIALAEIPTKGRPRHAWVAVEVSDD